MEYTVRDREHKAMTDTDTEAGPLPTEDDILRWDDEFRPPANDEDDGDWNMAHDRHIADCAVRWERARHEADEAELRGEMERMRARADAPCRACGWAHEHEPPSGKEPPIVRGALDAQADIERRLATERAARERAERERDEARRLLRESQALVAAWRRWGDRYTNDRTLSDDGLRDTIEAMIAEPPTVNTKTEALCEALAKAEERERWLRAELEALTKVWEERCGPKSNASAAVATRRCKTDVVVLLTDDPPLAEATQPQTDPITSAPEET